jgi:hypothetical protein
MVVKNVMKQIKGKSLELMVVALGFAAGGIWKDAIVEWLKPLMERGEGAVPLTITAIIVTAVVVVVIIALTKVLGEEE